MDSRLRGNDGVGGRLRDWMSLMESGPWVPACREDDGVGGRLRDWMSLMESGPWVHASARTTGLADGGLDVRDGVRWIPAWGNDGGG